MGAADHRWIQEAAGFLIHASRAHRGDEQLRACTGCRVGGWLHEKRDFAAFACSAAAFSRCQFLDQVEILEHGITDSLNVAAVQRACSAIATIQDDLHHDQRR